MVNMPLPQDNFNIKGSKKFPAFEAMKVETTFWLILKLQPILSCKTACIPPAGESEGGSKLSPLETLTWAA